MIKKLTTIIISITALLLVSLSNAYAADVLPNCGNPKISNTAVCPAAPSSDPIISIIKTAIEVISYIAGAATVILIIVSGLKFVTAGGSAESAASARNTLIYALVGIVVVIISQVLVVFVLDNIK